MLYVYLCEYCVGVSWGVDGGQWGSEDRGDEAEEEERGEEDGGERPGGWPE